MMKLTEPHVFSLEPYIPGKPIENNSLIPSWAKLASNENCLGPSPHAVEAASRALYKVNLYPNAERAEVVKKICSHLADYQVQPKHVALGNGSSELIVNLVRGLVAANESTLFGWPSFVMYRLAAHGHGREACGIPVLDDMNNDLEGLLRRIHHKKLLPTKLLFFANPNNPTGNYLSKKAVDDFLSQVPQDVVVVFDEAYFEYVVRDDYESCLDHALRRPRTVVLRTFSKAFGLAGLRLGYAVGDPEIIEVLCRIRDPFNVNTSAQYAAIAALDDKQHVQAAIKHNLEYAPKLKMGLEELGFFVHDSVCNFFLVKTSPSMPQAKRICDDLLPHGVIIRSLENYDLHDWVRISVGTEREIKQLFEGLKAVL